MTPSQAGRLLDFYNARGRQLPWRETRDPYRILISEVMLQQTQVETVKDYYRRFLERFPNFESLAQSPTEEVLGMWSGLGYYSRARRLHQTAQAVLERGGLPQTEEELLELPGVGPYTAAALASIAFGRVALALDGNALRVLCRLYGLTDSPQSKAVQRRLRQEVVPSIPPQQAGDFTQALMELGATVCKPRNPHCGECPWARGCRARRRDLIDRIPAAKKKRPVEEVSWSAALVTQGARVLLIRRATVPLKGLWVPPLADDLEALRHDFKLTDLRPLGETRHGITHRRIRTTVYTARLQGHPELESRWFTAEELGGVGLPSYTQKVLALVEHSFRAEP